MEHSEPQKQALENQPINQSIEQSINQSIIH